MKRIGSLLLASVFLLGLWGCGALTKGRQAQFVFVQCYEEEAYTTALAEGFCAAAKELGHTVTIVKPESSSAQEQAALIQELIDRGVRGIALNANETTGLEDTLEEAADAGIPVITVCRDTNGSDLLIQPSSTELVGNSLMDAMLDLTGGEGTFAVLSGETPFSGSDPWVHGMKVAAWDSKYETLVWAETNYSYDPQDGAENMKGLISLLLDKYPQLEVICCPGVETLVACCQAVEALDADLRVTGLSRPSRMKDLVGEDRACPYFFFWNPYDVGACAASALDSLCSGHSLQEGGTLVTNLGEYALFPGGSAAFYIVADSPYCFKAEDPLLDNYKLP